MASAAGLTPGKDFDRFEMFGGRKRCNVLDDGTITAYFGDESYAEDGSNGQVMVYQPAFYYKVLPVIYEENKESGIGYHLRKANYYVTSRPHAGFKLHPAFIGEDGHKVDYILYSAYEGCIFDSSADDYLRNDEQIADFNADMLSSISGVKPASGKAQSLTRANSEKLASNRGAGWHIDTIKSVSANQLLMIIEYGAMNMQAEIGQGIVSITDNASENCSSLTGSTFSLGSKTGQATETVNEIAGVKNTYSTNGKVAISYRGVENPWGNIWKHINGINIWSDGKMAGGQPYIADDFGFNETKNIDNYKPVGFTLPSTSGHIKTMGYGSEEFDWLFLPSEICEASNSPIVDYISVTSNVNGYKTAQMNGFWYSGVNSGLFCCGFTSNTGYKSRTFGVRLLYIPTKAH